MALIRREENKSTVLNNLIQGQTHTVLGPDAEFEGKLVFKGSVRIEGRFRGEIISEDTLVIGESADIEGKLHVGTLIVNGTCRANVRASVLVELNKTGQFYGSIVSPSLIVEKGAKLDGNCQMGSQENDEAVSAVKLKSDSSLRAALRNVDIKAVETSGA